MLIIIAFAAIGLVCLTIYLPAKFGKDLVHKHLVAVPVALQNGGYFPEISQLYGLFANSLDLGRLAGDKLALRFPFMPAGSRYELFAIFTPTGAIVFMQGNKEQFRVTVVRKEAGLEFELAYESTNWWRHGLWRFQWAGVVRGFDQAAKQLTLNQRETVLAPENLESGVSTGVHGSFGPFSLATYEIPVADLERATWFYHGVFGFEFTTYRRGLYWISLFGYPEQQILGALVSGHGYIPQPNGALAFIPVQLPALARQMVIDHGGQLVANYQNANGHEISKFIDTEGNLAAIISGRALV